MSTKVPQNRGNHGSERGKGDRKGRGREGGREAKRGGGREREGEGRKVKKKSFPYCLLIVASGNSKIHLNTLIHKTDPT